MLRFPNPGSDIDSFIRIFKEIFGALRNKEVFGLDDISKTLIERSLATSCGYMGEEALKLSTREDRSRDPLYNQAKMYSELYKVLGWIHPANNKALEFKFTYLGAHVSAASNDPSTIFKESILGIAYPNNIINVKTDSVIRPFATILKTMGNLDNLICRDEMIVGPLCLANDQDFPAYNLMIEELKSIRHGGWSSLARKVKKVSEKRNISTVTMGNYTRFPLAVLKWTGWAVSKRRKDVYGHSVPFLQLTNSGKQVLDRINSQVDLRANKVEKLDENLAKSVCKLTFYQMLERSGFDTSELIADLSVEQDLVKQGLGIDDELLFSPFQELSPTFLKSIFPNDFSDSEVELEVRHEDATDVVATAVLPQLATTVSISKYDAVTQSVDNDIVKIFNNAVLVVGDNLNDVVEYISNSFRHSNQKEFYPLISKLLCTLGFDCEVSRAGVNYQRSDAFIKDDNYSIPIEIKSPGEEEYISMKAVRQAIENKIILLSRKAFPTSAETTSLVVGYNAPNNRSDVESLVLDTYNAFKIVIGIVDFRSLLYLVGAVVLKGKKMNLNDMRNLRGIINVSDS